MIITFPYWNLAFWSGWSYTWGSVLFVLDGAWAWMPLQYPSSEFPGEEKYGVGLLFFFGALLYELGAVTAYLEAVNEPSFLGSDMRCFLDGHEEEQKLQVDKSIHAFLGHFNPHSWKHSTSSEAEDEAGTCREYLEWRWWPTWECLKTHHVYEIGYLACSIQLFGATLYGICGIVGLRGILDTLSTWEENAAYWIPQVVASVCFLTAASLWTLETQRRWYRPEFGVIGWRIAAWSWIGSMGFL